MTIINTLCKRNQFLYIKRQKVNRFFSSYCVIVYLFEKRDKVTENNICYAIKANKKLGNAVIRNKIKRRVRHLIRIMSKVSYFKGFDSINLSIIIIPKFGFEKILFQDLQYVFEKKFVNCLGKKQ